MRTLTFAVVALVACGKGGDKAAPTTGSGSETGSGSAAPTPAGSGSASTSATFAQTITPAGVGPITAATDPKTVSTLFPGLDAATKHDQTADHNVDIVTFSQGATPVLDVVIDNAGRAPQLFRVDVLGSRFATLGGIRTGSTVSDLAAKDPNTECKRETYDPNPENFDKALFCDSPAVPNVRFYLDYDGGPNGKVLVAKLASLPIKRIIWMPPVPLATTTTGTGTGGGSGATGPELAAGSPYCFEPNVEFKIDRLAVTDDTATFCALVNGRTTCVAVALATGAYTVATGTPPPKPPAEPVSNTDSEGKYVLKRTPKGVFIVDAKTPTKEIAALSVGDRDYKCVEEVRWLRSYIYATASLCNGPRAAGFLYGPDGKQQGGRLDGVNLQDAKPFHLKGDRWAFKSADSEAVMILDAANGEVGSVDPMTSDQAAKCCEVRVTGSIAPLALTPKNKLVEVGGIVGVIDLATGKPVHSWPLPVCKH